MQCRLLPRRATPQKNPHAPPFPDGLGRGAALVLAHPNHHPAVAENHNNMSCRTSPHNLYIRREELRFYPSIYTSSAHPEFDRG